MTGVASPCVDVEVELHEAIHQALKRLGSTGYVEGLERSLDDYARQLGLTCVPRVRLRSGAHRAIVVRADKAVLPYPPSFLARLWFGIAPTALRGAPDGYLDSQAFPDAWLIECSRGVVDADDDDGCQAIGQLISQLVLDVIALRPSALLTSQEATTVLDATSIGTLLSPVGRRCLLASLLDLGVTLPDPAYIRTTARDLRTLGRSAPDTLEELFAQRRAVRPQVEIEARLFSTLTGGRAKGDRLLATDESIVPEVKEAVAAAYGEILQKLGLRPWLEFIRNETFERTEMRVKVNDRTSPPIPLPGPDEVAVTARPDELRERGIEARPLIDAITGREQAAVPAASSGQLEEAGILPVPVVSYIAAAFGRAVMPVAYRLLSIVEVERELGSLESHFPVLVHAALARYTLGDIVRLLRSMAREQVSIRNLRRILGIMLSFDAAADEDLERLFMDDRLPSTPDGGGPDRCPGVDARLLAFVRTRMRDRVCFDSGIRIDAGPPARVYETDASFECLLDELAAARTRGEVEPILNRVRSAVWHAIARDADSRPVLVTATRVRLALRLAIEDELPAVPVLARPELVAGANTAFAGFITRIAE